MRRVALTLVLAAGVVRTSPAHTSAGPDLPNVLVVYADDLGYGDVAAFGGDSSRIPTPRLDALAAEGMAFTDAHSSSGVCSPSRYTLLTGRYHWRSRLQKGIVGLWEAPLIEPGRPTLGTLGQAAGLRTACIGKWHLGWDWPLETGDRKLLGGPKQGAQATDAHRAAWARLFGQPIPGGPTARGFDAYFGTDVPNWPPYCFLRDDRTVGIPTTFAAGDLFARNQASQQGPALEGWTLEPILPAITDEAVTFLEGCAEAEQPFLLYWSLTSPHTPLAVNEEFRGASGLGVYGDFVVETDAAIGRVLDALERLDLADDTLVLFTSDNGFAHYAGKDELEAQGHLPSGGLRGSKADAWEGGHRVPFIARWPGRVEAGSASNALVHQADLFRTVAEVLGLATPDDAGEDSWSLVPLLLGTGASGRTSSVSCSIRGVPSVRSGPWKLLPVPGSGGWTKGGDSEPAQVYDLSTDRAEEHNLYPEEAGRAAGLAALLEAEILAGRSTPGAPQRNDVEVVRHPVEGLAREHDRLETLATELEGRVEGPLRLLPTDPMAALFTWEARAFGVPLYATERVPLPKLLHAASVLAEYLDSDEDGRADEPRVVAALWRDRAAMVMGRDPRDLERRLDRAPEAVHEELDARRLQDLYAEEVHPGGAARGRFDATLEEVLHLVTDVGWAAVWPGLFGTHPGSALCDALDLARGGRFERVPRRYPAKAWFHYDDRTCDYGCMATEYLYWGLTSLLGAQDFPGRCEEIAHEWEPCTPEAFRATDRALAALLTGSELRLPATLPDGAYAPERPR